MELHNISEGNNSIYKKPLFAIMFIFYNYIYYSIDKNNIGIKINMEQSHITDINYSSWHGMQPVRFIKNM